MKNVVYKMRDSAMEMAADKQFPGTAGITFQVNTNREMEGYIRFVPYQNLEYVTEHRAQIEG